MPGPTSAQGSAPHTSLLNAGVPQIRSVTTGPTMVRSTHPARPFISPSVSVSRSCTITTSFSWATSIIEGS